MTPAIPKVVVDYQRMVNLLLSMTIEVMMLNPKAPYRRQLGNIRVKFDPARLPR